MTIRIVVSQKIMQRLMNGGSVEPEELKAIGMETLLSGYVGQMPA